MKTKTVVIINLVIMIFIIAIADIEIILSNSFLIIIILIYICINIYRLYISIKARSYFPEKKFQNGSFFVSKTKGKGVYLLVLAAYVIKIEKKFSRSERFLLQQYLFYFYSKISPIRIIKNDLKSKRFINDAINLYKEIYSQKINIEVYLKKGNKVLNEEEKNSILHFLFQLVEKNNSFTKSELSLLHHISQKFNIEPNYFNELKEKYFDKHHRQYTHTTHRSSTYSLSNAYATLSVSQDSDETQVKKAFRRLAMKHHPDHLHTTNSVKIEAAEKKFQEIHEAYELIMKKFA